MIDLLYTRVVPTLFVLCGYGVVIAAVVAVWRERGQ